MKRTFKIFYTLLFTVIFLSITHITAFAKTFPPQEVGRNKNWVIKFNDTIQTDNLFNDIQLLYNSKYTLFDFIISYDSKSPSEIMVCPPITGYVPGNYTLKISDTLKSTSGKKLKENYEIKFSVKDSKTTFVYNIYDLMSVAENKITDFKIADKRTQEVYDKATKIINTVTSPNMTDYEKEKALHNYIVKNTAYDYDNYLNDTIPSDSYTPYGILIKNTGVCQGYAETMKLLLNMVNIDCKVIHGQTEGGGHAWNKVKIDGKEYNLDATWDDPVPDHGPNYVRYDYFNISDDELSKDHDWDIDVTIDGKKQKMSYSNYKFYTENNIKLTKSKKITTNVSLPNGEKAPRGGLYISICVIPDKDSINDNDVYEKNCYIPEGQNSCNTSIDVPLNKRGYLISYSLDSSNKNTNHSYMIEGNYCNDQLIPEIIDGTNSDTYIANLVIPKNNSIKCKISLPNGESAPKNGVNFDISLIPYTYLSKLNCGGITINITSSANLTIPEGKNSIEYDLPAPINSCGYYVEYQVNNNEYNKYAKKYKEDGINITKVEANKQDDKVNITLSK